MTGYTSAHLRLEHADSAAIDRIEQAFNAGRLCHQFAPCPRPEPRRTKKILSSPSAAEKRAVAWRREHWGVPFDIGPTLFNSIERFGPSILQLHVGILDGDLGRFTAFLREQGFKVSRVRRAPSYRRGARIRHLRLVGGPDAVDH
jgi:hypothetical protein